jgi:hypothetical protein
VSGRGGVRRCPGTHVRIFLSHAHGDTAIATAVKQLLDDFFGDHVTVEFSSDQTFDGGVSPGERWHQWIHDRIAESAKTLVLLTPASRTSAWVLWEAGAASGVGFATGRLESTVPLAFGLEEDDVPEPFQAQQIVRGDSAGAGGISRLLQQLNDELGRPLPPRAFSSTEAACVPPFVAAVREEALRSAAFESLLATVPNSFSASDLDGHWATAYEFESGGATCAHADVAEVTARSDRRLRASNRRPRPVTEGHMRPFLNEIDAELVSRHVVGHWRNLSDTRYFGSLHLAVLSGECVMDGHYTALADDVTVMSGRWKWVRIDPATVDIDLATVSMKEPGVVLRALLDHRRHDGPITLDAVTERP